LAIGGQGYDPITTLGFGVLETWNSSSGTLISSLKTVSNNGVQCVSISPDGKSLAAGGLSSSNGVLELWNLTTNKLTISLSSAASFGVASVAFSPDGKTLADGGFGNVNSVDLGILETWSLASLTRIRAFQTVADASINSICFSPDSATLVDGGQRNMMGLVELWSVSTGNLTTVFDTVADPVSAVAFSGDGTTIAVGGQSQNGGVLETWSATSWDLLNTINTPKTNQVTAVSISPDGSTIVDGGDVIDFFGTLGLLEWWNATTGKRIRSVSFGTSIRAISFSPDGKTIAVGGYRATSSGTVSLLQIWSAANGGVINTIDTGATSVVTSVAFSPDGKTLAVAGKSTVGVLELWDVGNNTRSFSLSTAATSGVHSVGFSPDGNSIVDGGYDSNGGVIEAWNSSTGKSIFAINANATVIRSVAFSPDGTMIGDGGYGSSAGVLELRSPSTGKLISSIPLDLHAAMANPIAFSPDSAVLFAASDVGLQTFSTKNPAELDVFKTGFLRALAFSKAGSLMAFGMDNGVLVVAQPPQYDFMSITSLTFDPTPVLGGLSSTGTVTLSKPAPAGGLEISLSSGSTRATVPATVSVPAGASSVFFTVTTKGVNVQTPVVITAGYSGLSTTATLTIKPASLVSLNLVPAKIVGGNVVSGVVTLSGQAGQGGTVVGISVSNPLITAPTSVTVTEGQMVGRFGIDTPGLAAEQTFAVTALLGTQTQAASLTVSPATIATLSMDPTTIPGGTTSTGTVNLSGNAPQGGIVVALTSNTTGVTLPKNLPISAGQSRGSFTVKTVTVSAEKVATITVNLGTNAKTATLTVTPPVLMSLGLNPATVAGGASSGGMVTLGTPAGTGGISVKLSTNSTSTIVPPSVTVAAGNTQAAFAVKTVSVSTQKSATILASLNGAVKTAMLTITPPVLASISVNPASVVGGTPSKGTVTINGMAGTGGAVVNLASSSSSATLPSAVTIPANQSSATFVVKTLAVSAKTIVTLQATIGSVSKTAALAIGAPTLVSLVMSPNSVKGGVSSKGTVTISSNAPVGGLPISLSSDQPAAVPPTSVTIPAGAKSVTFTVKTTSVGAKTTAIITAGLGSTTTKAGLVIS